MKKLYFILALLNSFFSFSQSGFCFRSQQDYTLLNPLSSIGTACADYNNDGKMDIATIDGLSNVNIHLGNGAGTFSIYATYSITSGGTRLITDDFNNDSNPDIVVSSLYANQVNILTGNGTGNFTISPVLSTTATIWDLTTSDLNNDGNKDILVATPANLYVALGLGNNTFNTPTLFPGLGSTSGISKDFNNDGNNDYAYYNGLTVVRIALGNGTGNLTYLASFPTGTIAYTGAKGFSSADYNNDGNLDLAVGSGTSGCISVLLGSGTGTFGSGTIYPISSEAVSIISDDFNNDGVPDIAAVNISTKNISFLFNNGIGSFLPQINYLTEDNPVFLNSSDLNGDGKRDILISHNSGHTLFFLQKTNGYFGPKIGSILNAPAGVFTNNDFNNDGKLDIAVCSGNKFNIALGNGIGDFSISATSPSISATPGSICSADFNNDGNKDIALSDMSTQFVYIFYGNGTGGISSTYTLNAGTSPGSLMIDGDVNNDGYPDLILPEASSGKISVFLGTPSGSFSIGGVLTQSSLYNYGGITKNDFNNDGKLDIALTRNQLVQTFLGNGMGGFTYASFNNITGLSNCIVSSDFDNDGKQDIAVMKPGSAMSGSLTILKGAGTGSFTVLSPFSPMVLSSSPADMKSGDYDMDGNIDLAYCSFFSGNNKIVVLKGLGTGTFAVGGDYLHTYQPNRILSCDINNDGLLDLIAGNNDWRVTPLINSTAAIIMSAPLCTGTSSITLKAPKGAWSYLWNPGGSTADSIVVSTPGGTYSLTVTNMPCSGTTVKTISVSPLPSVSINSPSLICSGNTTTLTANGASTYTWSTSMITSSISVTPSVTTSYSVTGQNSAGCKNTASTTLSVSACTGIEELNLYNFSLYPNPANETISIKSNINEKSHLSIYNSLGVLCYETILNEPEVTINVLSLKSGVYFIKIETNKGLLNQKFVKE